MERRLVAILAADIVGYSQLMGADQSGTLDALRQLRKELFDPIVAGHRGNVVKRLGDGWIVEFHSITDAVACAIAIQDGLLGHDTTKLRIGIHTGEVVFEADDVFGDGVNVAARLEALADPGQVLISDTAHNGLDGKAAKLFKGGDTHELKNIARPIAVWRWPAENDEIATTAAEVLAVPDKPSIAVLPFDNMSGDVEQEYFADGITEDIITALTKFPWLFVIARNSVFTYKGRTVDSKTVSKELGVRYLIEGSVRRSGSRLRVGVRLVDADSGNHLKAERYDRVLEDIFELQDEITELISGTLAPEISSAERKRAALRRPESLDAWGLLQRGLNCLWHMAEEELAAASDYFRAAIKADPSFAQAYGYLSFALLHQNYLGFSNSADDTFREAVESAKVAVRLDEADPLAHGVLARIYVRQGRYEDAVAEARVGAQLNPNDALAQHAFNVVCIWSDRFAEAKEPNERAMRLSPNDPMMHMFLSSRAFILCELGELDKGVEAQRAACRMPREDYRMWLQLTNFLVQAGRLDEAIQTAQRVLDMQPDFTCKRFREVLQPEWHPDLHKRVMERIRKTGLPE